jgi:hypothetical protein
LTALSVLVVIEHLLHIVQPKTILVEFIVLFFTWLFTISYFIQLRSNLYNLYEIAISKFLIASFIISYSLLHGFAASGAVFREIPFPDKKIKMLVAGLILICWIIILVLLFIQYFLLAKKILKSNSIPGMKKLGWSFALVPIAGLISLVWTFFLPRSPFHHILVIIELLPYWFTYRIYKINMASYQL